MLRPLQVVLMGRGAPDFLSANWLLLCPTLCLPPALLSYRVAVGVFSGPALLLTGSAVLSLPPWRTCHRETLRADSELMNNIQTLPHRGNLSLRESLLFPWVRGLAFFLTRTFRHVGAGRLVLTYR